MTNESRDYLIRKGGYYYRSNFRGYTTDPNSAGRYTRTEAEREAKIEPWHMAAVPASSIAGIRPTGKEVDFHLRCVTGALEEAQDCIRGETPEDCSPEEAATEVLDHVRSALLKHLPELRKALQHDQ